MLPGGVQLRALDFALPRENLPQSHIRLEGAHGISTQGMVRDLVDVFGRIQELRDGGVGEFREFRKDQVLIAEFGKLCGEQRHCLVPQSPVRRPPVVQLRQTEIGLQRPGIGLLSCQGKKCFGQLIRTAPFARALAPVVKDFVIRLARENLVPDLQVPGHVRRTVGVPLEA